MVFEMAWFGVSKAEGCWMGRGEERVWSPSSASSYQLHNMTLGCMENCNTFIAALIFLSGVLTIKVQFIGVKIDWTSYTCQEEKDTVRVRYDGFPRRDKSPYLLSHLSV